MKTQLALVLIVIVGISGVAQFRKARKETSDATSTKDQLAKSLTLASYSLTDIRILEKYIEDNGHWEQAILLAVASKISSNAVPSPAIVDLPPPALVLADASTDLRQWALQLQSEQASNQTQEAIHDALERQGLLKEQLETAREEEKRLESQQAFLKTILPVYDAIIAQFSSLVFSVRNEPSHKDEKFSTTCGRWPSDQLIISSSPAVCEISLGTNSAWHFVITIGHQGEISRDHPPALYIRDLNKVGTLYIVVNGETISASFTAPHSLPKTVSGFQTNFQQILQEPFHYFLGESIIESHELDYAPH